MAARAKKGQKTSSRGYYFPAGALQSSFSAVLEDTLSLLALHMVFFPCCSFTWSSISAGTSHPCFTQSSFPAGSSHALLSLLVLHTVFPCWHFTWSSFPAGTSHGLFSLPLLHKCPTFKFCHGNQPWPPLIDISQAMTASLPQAVLSSGEQSRAI